MQQVLTDQNYISWAGQYLGDVLYLHIDSSHHITIANNVLTFYLCKSRYADFTSLHPNALFITINSTTILLSENGEEFISLLDNEKFIHLQLLFQLVSLAADGNLFYPATLNEMNDILIKRNLRCPKIITESDTQSCIATIRVCYDYLTWKINRISGKNLLTHHIQAKADYALRKVESFGYRLDSQKVDELYFETQSKIEQKHESLKSYGWSSGFQSERKYEEVVQSLGIQLPKTATGKISSAERHIVEYADQHPFFREYLDFHSLRKLQSTYLSKMKDIEVLYPHYKTLVSTGRTSSYDPNFQNFPKDQNFRQCFIPREGYLFLVADYSTIELCALAQTCITNYGQSRMAELINDGVDLHKWFASVLLNKSTDSVTKDERTYAKACNFGFPGGLGTKQFLEYAKYTYGISNLSLKAATEFKSKWLTAFPEMRQYLDANGQRFRSKTTSTTITGRIRNNCTFTQAKNFPFQGLASDGGKLALYKLIRGDYRVINYVHDEFVLEIPSVDLEELNRKVAYAEFIMTDQMRTVCPDLRIGVESRICSFWQKL